MKLPHREIDREGRLYFLDHRKHIIEANRPEPIFFENDVVMSDRFEVKVEDFVLDQRVDIVIEMPLRKSFGVQASENFVDDFLAFIDVKVVVSVHEVASILHV